MINYNHIQKAYDYANDHPDGYLKGTTNWCAAVAHYLNNHLEEYNSQVVPLRHHLVIMIGQCEFMLECAENSYDPDCDDYDEDGEFSLVFDECREYIDRANNYLDRLVEMEK